MPHSNSAPQHAFLPIPAVDIRGGRCVRLTKGDYAAETVYNDDPAGVALDWVARGAKRLHLIDLDGARDGRPVNLGIAREVASRTGVPIQWGGGVRSKAIAEELLEAGVTWLILGTVAVREPQTLAEILTLGPQRFLVSLDCRGGRIATQGWLAEEGEGRSAIEVGRGLAELGIAGFIYTNIDRDGTLQGIDPAPPVELAQQTGLPVIIAGGLGSVRDVQLAASHQEQGINGVILGKALYDGRITLEEALPFASPLLTQR